jgi:EH domain-containing protein 3
MHGPDERIIPGNAAATQADKPFRTLSQFGTAFLSKFQLSLAPIPILESMSFIDTPGVLSGEKQRLGRSYDFPKICEWFAEKSDVILLLFDAHKLDISDEYKRVISSLKNHEEKIRIVLNKVDMTTNSQFLRVYGALMYSLGRVIKTPEVMRVYFVALFDDELSRNENLPLVKQEMDDLLKDLYDLPRSSAVRKINDLVKRCRYARVHAYLISHLKREMPAMFGKAAKQAELIATLPDVFTKIQKQTGLPPGDFPDLQRFRDVLEGMDFSKFAKFSNRSMEKLEAAMNEDLPKLMLDFPEGPAIHCPPANPFKPDFKYETLLPTAHLADVFVPSNVFAGSEEFQTSQRMSSEGDSPKSILHSEVPIIMQYRLSLDEVKRYERVFYSMNPVNGMLSGSIIKGLFKEVNLPSADLALIWALSDKSMDGYVDFSEFAILMKLTEVRLAGGLIPVTIPEELVSTLHEQQQKL